MTVCTRRAVVLVVALALSVTTSLPLSRTAAHAADADVIVRGDGAAGAVAAVGGTVTRELPIVGGVAATVPAHAVERLGRGHAVSSDREVRFASTSTLGGEDEDTVNHVLAREVNADRLRADGIDGTGVTVALVDTGVSDVPDLAGRAVHVEADHLVGTSTRTDEGTPAPCVDFSGEGHCDDSFGHGTFMAGLIAGSGGKYTGVAPGARILSVKIAGRDGSADVSKVLAAIQWVVSFRTTYGVRVLNLSLGTDSTQDWDTDPLNYAVEQAWFRGVTVVVSAGNRGPKAISKPADDPYVITVGAVDDRQTPSIDDDRLPNFSSTGPTAHGLPKPDVVAPGGRVVSLRAPGSYVESNFPPGANENTVYRRGSGTSMSAAVVSGVAALVLQGRDWSPDRVKFALATTARKVAARDRLAVGRGLVDAQAARTAPNGNGNVEAYALGRSDGMGSLSGSRGTVTTTGPCSLDDILADRFPDECQTSGNETSLGRSWDPSTYADDDYWDGSSWYTTQWATAAAQGSSWYAGTWVNGSSWYGSSWYGSSWYGGFESSTFYGASLQGSSWYGAWG